MTEREISRAMHTLHESKEHWERLRDGVPGERPFAEQCACCERYQEYIGCGSCPIRLRTGRNLCVGTPYGRFTKLWSEALEEAGADSESDVESTPELRAAAQGMIDFLQRTIEWTKRQR